MCWDILWQICHKEDIDNRKLTKAIVSLLRKNRIKTKNVAQDLNIPTERVRNWYYKKTGMTAFDLLKLMLRYEFSINTILEELNKRVIRMTITGIDMSQRELEISKKQKRKNAIDFACGSVRYEGFLLTPEAESLFQRYINDELINDELNALVLNLATNASEKADEGLLAANRIRELTENPVQGNFDEVHLCEIHRRIFQDMPYHKPGQYRTPEPEGMIRYKNRVLEDGTMPYHVWYATRKQIDSSLKQTLNAFTSIEKLRKLDKEQFAEELAKLYADLDYYHPFSEGNSRTLRSFTQQLAMAAGFDLDWNAKNANRKLRDELYIARDREVTEKRFPGLRNGDFSEDAQRTFMMLYKQKREVRSLQQIIADATRKISI